MKEKAISEVLGAVLLIAIVTASMGIVAVVLTSNIIPTIVPHMDFESCINGGTIYLYHSGGDTLRPQEINGDLYINLVDNNGNILQEKKFLPWENDQWSAGQVRNISTSLQPTKNIEDLKVQLIAKTGEGDTLIEWAQLRNCSGISGGGSIPPGPGCLARPHASFIATPQTSPTCTGKCNIC